eukprot:CAMPEP_0114487266 /NCGR_PEP_ID=MMETSP0109-20121206/673_1 /TAXON_ID=29199 /ORGANISM="Chlorarachnion reptans, Strain CCCM449" /LENGTH=548 /DNA_ID=CAMNT_0001663517 /DNA_START=54 /DNA_END=1698 /DNA_ORIENTATION=+
MKVPQQRSRHCALNSLNTGKQRVIDELQITISKCEDEIFLMKRSNEKLNVSMAIRNQELERARAECGNLGWRLQQKTSQLSRTSTIIQELRLQVGDLESEILKRVQSNTTDRLKGMVEQRDRIIQEKEVELKKRAESEEFLTEDLSKVRESLERVNAKNANLQEQIQVSQAELEDKINQCRDLEKTINERSAGERRLVEKLAELKGVTSRYENETKILQHTCSQLRSLMDNREKLNEALQQEISSVRKSYEDEVESKLETLNAERQMRNLAESRFKEQLNLQEGERRNFSEEIKNLNSQIQFLKYKNDALVERMRDFMSLETTAKDQLVEIGNLQQKFKEKVEDKAQMESTILTLKTMLKRKSTEAADSSSRCEILRERLKKAEESLVEHKSVISNLTSSIRRLNYTNTKVSSHLHASEKNLRGVLKERDALSEINRAQKRKIHELHTQVDTTRLDTQVNMANISDQLIRAKAERHVRRKICFRVSEKQWNQGFFKADRRFRKCKRITFHEEPNEKHEVTSRAKGRTLELERKLQESSILSQKKESEN